MQEELFSSAELKNIEGEAQRIKQDNAHKLLMEKSAERFKIFLEKKAELEDFPVLNIQGNDSAQSVSDLTLDEKYSYLFAVPFKDLSFDLKNNEGFSRKNSIPDLNLKFGLFGIGLTAYEQKGLYVGEGEELPERIEALRKLKEESTERGQELATDTKGNPPLKEKGKIIEEFPKSESFLSLPETIWTIIYLLQNNKVDLLDKIKGKNIRIYDNSSLHHSLCVVLNDDNKIEIKTIPNKDKTAGLLVKSDYKEQK